MPETTSTQPIIGPADSATIEYRAFARDFGDGQVIVSAMATASYPVSPYELFFQGGIENLELMQKAPVNYYFETSYPVAVWTLGMALVHTPSQLTITDAGGPHTVEIESWTAATAP